MTTIKPKDLNSFMTKLIVRKYKELQVRLPEYLKEFIYSEYYDKYSPSELYDRQYRIIDAIMVSNIKVSGVTISMEIYLDPEKVSYDPSIWKFPNGSFTYIKGDESEDVWNLMRQGIHGDKSVAVTDGDFWQAFIDSVNHGGIHDLFAEFKKYLSGKSNLSII